MSEAIAKAILLCNFGLQDRQNRWSLIATFDTFHFQSMPAHWSTFFVFARICDVPKRGSFLVHIEDPRGMVIWTSGQVPYEISEEIRTMEHLVGIAPTVVTEFGKYRVVFFVNADRVGETDLFIQKTPEKVRA